MNGKAKILDSDMAFYCRNVHSEFCFELQDRNVS